jgi:hypothetical protein
MMYWHMVSPDYQTSRLLSDAGFKHAFFTRRGGVSNGAFSSLNFSVKVGDDEANVAENLARAALALDIPRERLYFLSQVHGTITRFLSGDEQREAVLHQQGDAVGSLTAGVACAVRTADCVPVLVGDRKSGAALAIHAGWRGVVDGIVPCALGELRQALGGMGELVAAIGPHISRSAFEVSPVVADQLRRASDAADPADHGRAKPHVDLRAIVRAQLAAAALAPHQIDDVPGCTVSDPELYFSFRRDGPHSGRHLHAIVARQPRGTHV